jgi:tetrapyrrole methylase family protein/MazG family protein
MRPTVTVVGLGPGDERFVTDHTRTLIADAARRFVRTRVHPSASLVGDDAVSFDDVYEAADTFDDVYAEIVERLVAAATEHGEVLYAVPGSPLVLERTVATLRADERVTTVLHPAMSFLDLAWARLGVDPVEVGARLVDGHRFAAAAAGWTGPMLVAHTHADWVLSDIKLAVDADGDEPVVILQGLGTDVERVIATTWADLDRTVTADHLTSVWIPSLGTPVGAELVRFHELARTLRERCPWDVEQTHSSLVRYLLEETYEVVDAIEALDPDDPTTDDALVEELGDLLYQIEFHSVIAEQEGRFSMADVARAIHDKLVRRHPHVFGDVEVADDDELRANWDAIKQAEKGRTSVFDGVASSQPAMSYATTLLRRAAAVGFVWRSDDQLVDKLDEELGELRDALRGVGDDSVDHEVGDVLLAVANLARHHGIDAERALRAAAARFRRRVEHVERSAAIDGVDLRDAPLDDLLRRWHDAKVALGPAEQLDRSGGTDQPTT